MSDHVSISVESSHIYLDASEWDVDAGFYRPVSIRLTARRARSLASQLIRASLEIEGAAVPELSDMMRLLNY